MALRGKTSRYKILYQPTFLLSQLLYYFYQLWFLLPHDFVFTSITIKFSFLTSTAFSSLPTILFRSPPTLSFNSYLFSKNSTTTEKHHNQPTILTTRTMPLHLSTCILKHLFYFLCLILLNSFLSSRIWLTPISHICVCLSKRALETSLPNSTVFVRLRRKNPGASDWLFCQKNPPHVWSVTNLQTFSYLWPSWVEILLINH